MHIYINVYIHIYHCFLPDFFFVPVLHENVVCLYYCGEFTLKCWGWYIYMYAHACVYFCIYIIINMYVYIYICIWIYVYIHICTYVYIHICITYIYICIHMCLCIYMYINMHIYIYIYIYVYMYLYKYVYMYVCIYICMYMYKCIHIWISIYVYIYTLYWPQLLPKLLSVHPQQNHNKATLTYNWVVATSGGSKLCVCVSMCVCALLGLFWRGLPIWIELFCKTSSHEGRQLTVVIP